MIALQTEKLTKIYGGKRDANSYKALNGIDFKIHEGEFVGIMGPSGSGKTTLLNVLSGIDKATAGNVEISGVKLDSMNNDKLALFRRKSIGFVFQDFNLLNSLTLKENIMLPMILDKKGADAMEKVAMDYMKLFGIEHISEKYPYNVSGGEQQRVAVARALVNKPAIVFADEPTGNLDSKSSNGIMNCFKKMNEEKNVTVLMVTHDTFAASFCRRIIFIKDGCVHSEIVRRGQQKEFFNEILDCLSIIGGGIYDI